MNEIIVISGKGGTGKTSLVAAFAKLAENKVLCDADVDAADLHLITAPVIQEQHDFQSGHTAVIAADRCTGCGICRDPCQFDAISEDYVVDPTACEGCSVCVHFCPEKAVDFPLNSCGQWFVSDTRFGPMVHARLGIAEENSGKLVSLVRQQARRLAEEQGLSLILTEGPPGVGCPVIAAIGGATGVLLVTEPTVSGIHDMQRVVELAAHFHVPVMISINKWDLNPEMTSKIEDYARKSGLFLAGNIPFDQIFTQAMVQGQTIFEYNHGSEAGDAVQSVWENILVRLSEVVSH
ncbi:MinD superfamily P-loop ATPase containing an inserted ferredoxin domain [Olavius algarvensis associated proteobacterium Delta 3]|nr:MinD superfamily P-loop ATPase containing an inserted ferredoxin domain [Olavius algarvensis associated proteobacterium Delta 3]CAB5166906.1 MinD superfamily P-loop ATPase containing an inserted ferredoxin domain [Olavius algarvensis associated proteobacterium Delta 3]